jgi:hypothetical protein
VAQYEHLPLVRLPERLERRKKPGFGGALVRDDRAGHRAAITTQLNSAIQVQQQRRKPDFVDPSLILRVRLSANIVDEEWERVGLTILSSDADRSLVLFSSTDDLQQFRARVDAYGGDIPAGQAGAPYAGFVAAIESIGQVEPRDRIGLRLREAGFTEPEEFLNDRVFIIDLELWDLGRRDLRNRKLDELAQYVEAQGGEVFDRYLGASISLLRVSVSGQLLRTLLTVEDISSIDLPPEPDTESARILELELGDLPELRDVDADAPIVGVIDSGINAHPLIEGAIVGAIGVPEHLGTADEWGHGTKVAGLATFGDLKAQIDAGILIPGVRICAAKVLNAQGEFDQRRLVPSQMREAISRLNAEFGCRIFVIALGDKKRTYDGGKVGAWAATLDELARELNVLIFVSAGNRKPRGGNRIEQAVTEYPQYLAEEGNRLLEPAGAVNVVTVGALAHGNGLSEDAGEHVNVRPITEHSHPSPFTRVGPGVDGAIKPDLVDFGGTFVFDSAVMRLRGGEDIPAAGLISLHHQHTEQLFTSGSGTSYSTPLVALKASQILRRFPNASSNLVRALLAGAATIPDEAKECLQGFDEAGIRNICGHGVVDAVRAAYSDEARVVFYAEDSLALDHFAVYEIPVPEVFQTEAGRRTIKVTLAFDPPVRNTRVDYAGVNMSFRLIRGCNPDLIFDHYRKRTQDEGGHPEIAVRFQCALEPKSTIREKSTLQTAAITFQRDISGYGSRYFLVVRCESGWAKDAIVDQRYALVVELSHEAEIQLYERARVRV